MTIRFQVDTDFYDHPKVLGLSDAAVALWTRAGSYSAGKLLDGFVPDSALTSLSKTPMEAAGELVEAGLWRRVKGGYRFHQWAVRNLTKAEVETDRKAARNRKRRERSRNNDVTSPQVNSQNVTASVTRDVTRDSRRPSRVSHSPSVSMSVSESVSSNYVGKDLVDRGQVSDAREPKPGIEDEHRSGPVDIDARKLSREYTDRIGLVDKAKVAAIVKSAQSTYSDEQIAAALGRLCDRPDLPLTADVIRIEIETQGKPRTRDRPSTTRKVAAGLALVAELEAEEANHQHRQIGPA